MAGVSEEISDQSFDQEVDKEFLEEERGLTFDDMVSFTMFTEICTVLLSIILFIAYLWYISY